jgi:DNA invertase Pin-like site-specific DNA recombinase
MYKAIIYARTSKKTQKIERQISDLNEVARKENYKVVKVVEEKISGTTKNEKRKGVSELLNFITNNKVDIVLTSEVSRLGRSPFETNKIVEELTQKGIPIYFHSYRIVTLIKDENGLYKRNPLAMILFNILNEFAFLEKEVLIERINSGLAEAKRKGVKLGRKVGTKKTKEEVLKQYSKLAADLRNGLSLNKAMKIYCVSKGTVIRVKRFVKDIHPQ